MRRGRPSIEMARDLDIGAREMLGAPPNLLVDFEARALRLKPDRAHSNAIVRSSPAAWNSTAIRRTVKARGSGAGRKLGVADAEEAQDIASPRSK